MARTITTQLMFEGKAEEAINFYVSLFPDSRVVTMERAAHGVHRAVFTLAGQTYAAIDSPVKHAFTFTPALSLFVDCENEAEFQAAFNRLSEGGSVLMPPDNYGFSRRFAWVQDRFGVSWQLNLP